jgi:hypothetical protein
MWVVPGDFILKIAQTELHRTRLIDLSSKIDDPTSTKLAIIATGLTVV